MNYRRPSLFWPIILIGVGVVFLLSNLGIITGNPWPVIWRLWPLLLIVIGLDILLGRRAGVGSLISAVLALLVVGGVLWVLIAKPTLPGLTFSGELQTKQIEYPLKDIQSAKVSIGFTTGTNQLNALSDSSNLIEGAIRHYGTLNFSAADSAGLATIGLHSSDVSFGFPFGDGSQERWDVSLNPKVAYDLDLDMGVGQSTIDLTKLTLTAGRINAGVGTTDLRLPSTGKFTMSIDGGVGTVRIHLPGKMALHVEVDTGIGTFNPGSRLRSVGDNIYETEGFSSADNASTLRVKAGVGTISVIDSE